MRFTPTATYTLLVRGAAKSPAWHVWFRATNDLSQSVSGTAGWTDISSRIVNFDDITAQLEYNVGQFTLANLNFSGVGVQFFKSLFTLSAGYYGEIKCVVTVSLGTLLATDEVIPFSGLVDLGTVQNDELTDAVSFTAYSILDNANRIAGEELVTQYICPDIVQDLTGVQGLILRSLTNVFVKSANVTGFPLQLGQHTIEWYQRVIPAGGGTEVGFTLDGGPNGIVTGDGEITLTNPDGTQKLLLYLNSYFNIPIGSGKEYVVVTTVGDTLPKQWYIYPSVRQLLTAIYAKIGITSITWDSVLTYKSAPAAGLSTPGILTRYSFVDNPPNDGSKQAGTVGALPPVSAMAAKADGTKLYIAVGKRIYVRDMATDTYTLLATLSDWTNVRKLILNERNNHLWMFYTNDTDYNATTCLRRLDLAGPTLQAAVTLSTTAGAVVDYAVYLYDFEYETNAWHYSVVYADSSAGTYGTLRECDGLAMTLSDVVVGIFTAIIDTGRIIYGTPSNGYIWFPNHKSTDYYFTDLHIDSGSWVIGSAFGSGSVLNYAAGCYNPGDTYVYFISKNGADTGKIMRHAYNAGTATLVQARIASTDEVLAFASDGTSVYWTRFDLTAASPNMRSDQVVFKATGGTPAVIGTGVHSKFSTGIVNSNGIMFGLDSQGFLYRIHTSVSLAAPIANFSGMSVLEALNSVLQSFNLVAIVTATKAAYVYRRNDETGAPVSSGHTLSLTVDEASALVEAVQHIKPVDYVAVTGEGGQTVNYNGNTYNQSQFSTTPNVSVSSELIPAQILNEIAFHVYKLFNTGRNLYQIEAGLYPAFEWEPFDAGQVTFTTTHVQKSGTGVLYTTIYKRDGTLSVEVLL